MCKVGSSGAMTCVDCMGRRLLGRFAVALFQIPQCNHFALDIPTCWYLKSLADPTGSIADPKREASLTQHKQVE